MNNAGDVIGTGMMNEGIVRTWEEFFIHISIRF